MILSTKILTQANKSAVLQVKPTSNAKRFGEELK